MLTATKRLFYNKLAVNDEIKLNDVLAWRKKVNGLF